MRFDISKMSLLLLLFSLPMNIVLIRGIGNVYLSTILIFVQFALMTILSNAKILKGRMTLVAIELLIITSLTTLVNILLNGELIHMQITKTVIYTQNILTIILMSYFMKTIALDYFFKCFVIVILISIIRVYIQEPDHFFRLSVLWEERIESEFVAGVNTFAMLVGLAFIISFFYFKQKFTRFALCAVFLIMIVLTMSRGALLAAIITLFATTFYDTDKKTFELLVKYSFIGFLSIIFFLVFSGKMDSVLELINERFFSFFNEEKTANAFFAGRGDLVGYVFEQFLESNIFQFLFGHGNGSMSFVIPETGQKFETSHFVILDILYRNGVILTVLYLLLLIWIFLRFLKNRSRGKVILFGLFLFLQLELLVNPMIFSAQAGWVYSLFIILFIKQDSLTININEKI
jgi:O-antigen ligase